MQTIKKLLSQLFVLFSLVAAINAVMVIAYPLGQINDWPRFLLTEGALNSQEEWEDFTSIEQLEKRIHEYIYYYNHERVSTKLKGLSPVQYRNQSSL